MVVTGKDDRFFEVFQSIVQALANHIIVLSKNGVIDRIDETYDEFLENAEVQAKVKELWKD